MSALSVLLSGMHQSGIISLAGWGIEQTLAHISDDCSVLGVIAVIARLEQPSL